MEKMTSFAGHLYSGFLILFLLLFVSLAYGATATYTVDLTNNGTVTGDAIVIENSDFPGIAVHFQPWAGCTSSHYDMYTTSEHNAVGYDKWRWNSGGCGNITGSRYGGSFTMFYDSGGVLQNAA